MSFTGSGGELVGNVGLRNCGYDFIIYGKVPNMFKDGEHWKQLCDEYVARCEKSTLYNVIRRGSEILSYFSVSFIECIGNEYGIAIRLQKQFCAEQSKKYAESKLQISDVVISPYVVHAGNGYEIEYFVVNAK